MPRVQALLTSVTIAAITSWGCTSERPAGDAVGEDLVAAPPVVASMPPATGGPGPRAEVEPEPAPTDTAEPAPAPPAPTQQQSRPQPLRLSIPRGEPAFPPAIDCGDATLALQGAGLCEWGFLGIDLYRCAFYVEKTIASADEALRADQRMVVHLDFVRALSKDQLSAAWTGSVEVNTKGDAHDHAAALRQLCDSMRDVDDGDSYSFVLAPEQGMRVLCNGDECARIDDEAFRKLFVKLYLGPNPPTKALRKAMLGGAK